MDLQTMLDNAVQAERAKVMKASPQLTLGELILKLEAVEVNNLPVFFDVGKIRPTGIDSWRGSYCELALEYDDMSEPLVLKELLKLLNNTIGKTLTGYKGGNYLMGKTTPVWVANYGDSQGFRPNKETAVVGVLVKETKVLIKTRAMDY